MEYSEIIYLISQRTEEDEIGNNTSSFISSKNATLKNKV